MSAPTALILEESVTLFRDIGDEACALAWGSTQCPGQRCPTPSGDDERATALLRRKSVTLLPRHRRQGWARLYT